MILIACIGALQADWVLALHSLSKSLSPTSASSSQTVFLLFSPLMTICYNRLPRRAPVKPHTLLT
ncbi:hypothetical protein THIOM_001922 [Candidatus Thiomargarita nelsonii]|uniref:Uncharacterized protein n=1 Tax=Candidatus Thiomargarita nelsonii TaxID=1003181 RepID=A0A176S318_9GAMM|nr:hypothetical protein THIOM_001922 [Candidatus Thiomargarita nelsonii]